MYGDINPLYRDLIYVNNQLKELKESGKLPEEEAKLRDTLHGAVGAVYGTNEPITQKSQARGHKGFLTYISGVGSPKFGYFQKKLMSRSQDVTGRGTIVPDSTLGIDEVGLPENMIWGMYEPFLIRNLVRQGYPALQAKDMVKDKHPAARDSMLREIKERPVMINRAPTLHRYNIIGAYPVPVPGKTIRTSPFLEVGMNADYDGDTLMVHTPVSQKAIEEVKKMTLSNLLYGDKSKDDLLAVPRHEAMMGIAHASSADDREPTKVFANRADLMKDYAAGKIGMGTHIKIKDSK
jgi:DNA-directed RNA polymerase subunit beta'